MLPTLEEYLIRKRGCIILLENERTTDFLLEEGILPKAEVMIRKMRDLMTNIKSNMRLNGGVAICLMSHYRRVDDV